MNVRVRHTLKLFTFMAIVLPIFALILGCGEETTEEETPKVSDITISVTGNKAKIAWKTDVPADSQVQYGTTENYGSTSTDETLERKHLIELKDLKTATYHFQIKSKDASGVEGKSGDFTFTTLEEGKKGPEISEVEATTSGIIVITWKTNETTVSLVEYGEDTSYGLTSESKGIEHNVLLTGQPGITTYHYRIKATDLDGNVATSSDFSFKIETKSQDSGESVKKISMTAQQFRFSPSTIRVKEGTKVVLTIRSVDVTHGFGLSEFRINRRLPPNKEVTVEFVADDSGEFPFLCTVNCGAGHANMNGKLIVEEE